MTAMNDQQQALVEDNIALAYWLSGQWYRTYATFLEKDELTSIIFEAFCKAAIKFDPSRGCPFSGFAARCAKNKLISECVKICTRDKYLASKKGEAIVNPPDSSAYMDLCIALSELPERSRDIFLRHYQDGDLQIDIAQDYGLSPSRVCEIIQETRDLLRDKLS